LGVKVLNLASVNSMTKMSSLTIMQVGKLWIESEAEFGKELNRLIEIIRCQFSGLFADGSASLV
jgi:hypothetical protein